jgi:hypothetical protein
MKRWWIFIILGCLLLWPLLNIVAGLIAFFLALFVLWFAQMGRANLLLARIQEGVRKLEKTLRKWSS